MHISPTYQSSTGRGFTNNFQLVPSFIDYKHNEGPYKLVCDDLRPGNILVDRNLKITAICDWEWSYAAPYQQFYTAPRWLMLKAPEYWRITEPYDDGSGDGHSGAGLDDMLRAYTKKLDLFLKIMQEEEAKRAAGTYSIFTAQRLLGSRNTDSKSLSDQAICTAACPNPRSRPGKGATVRSNAQILHERPVLVQ